MKVLRNERTCLSSVVSLMKTNFLLLGSLEWKTILTFELVPKIEEIVRQGYRLIVDKIFELIEFLPREETINVIRYCETLLESIQNKLRGMLPPSFSLALHSKNRNSSEFIS